MASPQPEKTVDGPAAALAEMSNAPREAMKQLWVVNHHARVPAKDGGAGRHLKLAQYLPEHGWEVSLIIASTVHPQGVQAMNGLKLRRLTQESGVPVLWVKASAYGTSMLRRLIGMGTFAMSATLPGMTRGLRHPDAVVGSTVHLLGAWAGMRLARRHGVPFIFEIRDVWPETLIHMGKVKQTSRLAWGMRRISVKLSREASMVISPLPSVGKYLEDHGIDASKFLWVSNGFDGERESVELEYKPSSGFTFMYLGSHGNANALEGTLAAFDRACSMRPDADLRLRLVGAGSAKKSLIQYAQKLSSSERITFEEHIPEQEVVRTARESDCLVASMHDSPVYEYGISLNKLYTYMYAFRPVVFASNAPNPITDSGSGIVVPAEHIDAMAHAMVTMYEMPHQERLNRARRGYEHVLKKYSFRYLSSRLAQGLDDVRPR